MAKTTRKPIVAYITSDSDRYVIQEMRRIDDHDDYFTEFSNAKKLRFVIFLLFEFEVVRQFTRMDFHPTLRDSAISFSRELSNRGRIQLCIALLEQLLETYIK